MLDTKIIYPSERTIRIATTFSGIGAPEQALLRLDLKVKHVFACDNGERYLKYTYKQHVARYKLLDDDDKEKYAESLFKENKASIVDKNKKRKENNEKEIPFSL